MAGAAGEPREGEACRCAGLAGREQGRTPAAPPGAGGGPHRGGDSGGATVWGERAGLPRRPRPLRAHTSNLLLVTPFTSLLMGPAGAARPGRALRRAECKDRGPGRPASSGSGRRRRPGEARPARPTRRTDRSSPVGASTTARGVRGRDDCQSLARVSPKPQLQPKTKTLPTCQQRRSSLGRAARASERRGRGGALRRGGRASPPLPQGAQPRTVSPRAAGARGGRARAHPDEARQGSARVCVCVRGGGVRGGGGRGPGSSRGRGRGRGGCARARSRTGEQSASREGRSLTGTLPAAPKTPRHAPTHAEPGRAFSLQSPARVESLARRPELAPTSSWPPNSRPLSLTVALNPKCSRRSLLGAIFPPFSRRLWVGAGPPPWVQPPPPPPPPR